MQNNRHNSWLANVDWGKLWRNGTEWVKDLPPEIKLILGVFGIYEGSKLLSGAVDRVCDSVDTNIDRITERGYTMKVSSDGFSLSPGKDNELPEPTVEGEFADLPEINPEAT